LEEKNINEINNESNIWNFILLLIISWLPFQNEFTWNSFHDMAKKGELVGDKIKELADKVKEFEKLIKKKAKKLTLNLSVGSKIFRARKAGMDLFVQKIIEVLGEKIPEKIADVEIKEFIVFLEDKTVFTLGTMMTGLALEQNPQYKIEIEEKWKVFLTSKFKGYSADDSMQPPPARAKIGRANNHGESFLYAAFDLDTCIYEVKPIIGERVSYAEIEVIEELKLFDLTKASKLVQAKRGEKEPVLNIVSLESAISEAFSVPNYCDEGDYKSTIIIATRFNLPRCLFV